MANLPRLKSTTRPARDIKEKLESRTGINNFSADSAASTITNAVATAIVRNHNETVNAFDQIQISSASGINLDQIAISHGLSRNEPVKAISLEQERSVYFYVASGTFGDINGGNDISLPAGTKIFPSNATRNGIAYEVLYDYTLPAVSNRAYCSIRAVSFGSSQNVGPRSLTSHSLTEFPGLYCTNKYAIVNGRTRETDEALRDRISFYFKTLSINNRSALLMEALAVPGVLDLAIIEGYYGIGTCGVFIFGADGFSNTSLVNQLTSRVSQINTAGLKVIVSTAIQVNISFEVEVSVNSQLTTNEVSFINSSIKQSIVKYISSGNNRRTIDLKTLRDFIMVDNPRILSILPKRSNDITSLFKNVYIERKHSGLDVGSIRETMATSVYNLKQEEFAAVGFVDVNIRVNL